MDTHTLLVGVVAGPGGGFDINAADCDHWVFSSKVIHRQAALWLPSSSEFPRRTTSTRCHCVGCRRRTISIFQPLLGARLRRQAALAGRSEAASAQGQRYWCETDSSATSFRPV